MCLQFAVAAALGRWWRHTCGRRILATTRFSLHLTTKAVFSSAIQLIAMQPRSKKFFFGSFLIHMFDTSILHPIASGYYYRKRGSASYIVREVLSVRERERERERYRERRKWRHHCRAKIGDEFTPSLAKKSHKWRRVYTFPCQKFALFVSAFTLPVSPFLNGHHCGAEIRNEFTLPLPKNFSLLVR